MAELVPRQVLGVSDATPTGEAAVAAAAAATAGVVGTRTVNARACTDAVHVHLQKVEMLRMQWLSNLPDALPDVHDKPMADGLDAALRTRLKAIMESFRAATAAAAPQ